MTAKEDCPCNGHNASGTDRKPDWESLARDKYALQIEHTAAQLVRSAFTKLSRGVRQGEPTGEEILHTFSKSAEALDTYVLSWARSGEQMDSDVLHTLEVGLAVFADFTVTARSLHKGSFDDDDLDRLRRGLDQADRLLDELEGTEDDQEVDDGA
jgi:hypothetical protein